ncbi:Neuropilin-1a [Goodea atripinnis]|uniref:Neuropilin-1a n=1 Tax=Goodea atripinnis TaxID=208336 RepID=A0ABV0NGL6_9TELE
MHLSINFLRRLVKLSFWQLQCGEWYDYVEVRDGVDENGQLVGKYCGKIAPSAVVSSGNQLFIKFVSDYETHGAGFSIRYEIFKTGPECSKNFTSNSGVIKSPGFPEKYPNNLDCTFMIFAPKMSEIILEFENFELEPDTTPPTGVFCRYDRLEIWDGFPGGGMLAAGVCRDWRCPGKQLGIHTSSFPLRFKVQLTGQALRKKEEPLRLSSSSLRNAKASKMQSS